MATYEYGGKTYELKDGLSNEEALGKIKASLGEAPPAPESAAAPPSMMSHLGRYSTGRYYRGITNSCCYG